MTLKEWTKYRDLMSQICQKAADEFRDFAMKREGGIGALDRQTVLEYAYALVQKYGQASGELACMFYEQIADAQNVVIPPAEMAALPEFGEVAKAVNGAIKQSEKNAPGAVERLTKQVGADTMLQNAKRDGASFAWITAGDTCAYCMMMSAIGWQKAGKKTLSGNHAEHIHAHCDCQYVVDFKGDLKVDGYDPEGMRKDIMQIADPDGGEYGGDFNSFLKTNGRQSMKVDRKGLKALRNRLLWKNNGRYNSLQSTAGDYLGVPKSWNKIGDKSKELDISYVNPNYRPHFSPFASKQEMAYNRNCVNCVVTYDLRRRGYDVTARSMIECNVMNKLDEIWIDPDFSFIPKTYVELQTKMREWEDGARAVLGYDTSKNLGHVIIVENRKGQIMMIDPQKNRVYNKSNEIDDIIRSVSKFFRVDDLEVSQTGYNAAKAR